MAARQGINFNPTYTLSTISRPGAFADGSLYGVTHDEEIRVMSDQLAGGPFMLSWVWRGALLFLGRRVTKVVTQREERNDRSLMIRPFRVMRLTTTS